MLIFLWLAPTINIQKTRDWGLRVDQWEDFSSVVDYLVTCLAKDDLKGYLRKHPSLVVQLIVKIMRELHPLEHAVEHIRGLRDRSSRRERILQDSPKQFSIGLSQIFS